MNRVPLPAQIARAMRSLRHVRGWRSVAELLAGQSGDFVVTNHGARYAGRLSSFIDRQAYLFGGYEVEMIDLFLSCIDGRSVILDIGANSGNHSVLFSKAFDRVLSFEPNPSLIGQLSRNAELNTGSIEIFPYGLSDTAGEFQLYNIDNGNLGLATFLKEDQYDQALQEFAVARTEVADEQFPDLVVDAIKIDVQGFEPQVLMGMQALLKRSKPVVWVEFGAGTLSTSQNRSEVEALFPYPIDLQRFCTRRGRVLSRAVLETYDGAHIELGDYVITPK